MKYIKLVLIVAFVLSYLNSICQRRNDSNWNNGLKLGVTGFNKINFEIGYSWVNPDSYGLEVSSEFQNYRNLTIGPKLTLKKFFYFEHLYNNPNSELILYQPSLGLENMIYTDFNQSQYCIRPTVGIHVLEFLEVNYGYSIYVKGDSDFQSNLNKHTFSIVLRWANLRDME